MAKTQRNFVLGRMNKSLDERLLKNGEYIDAQNVRLGSTEEAEVGSVENAKGNSQLTELYFIDLIFDILFYFTDSWNPTCMAKCARCTALPSATGHHSLCA